MQNHQYSVDRKSSANASDAAEFGALAVQSGRYSNQALLFALAQLFVQNTAPRHWEVDQFQELMLNLIPVADLSTRQELGRLLSQATHTPARVLHALELEPLQDQPKPSPLPHTPEPVLVQQQPVYQIDQLKQMLPLQISRKMAQVAALAAKRGDRHILKSILASHLTVSRPFADFLLSNHDGLFLATALRALRMPGAVAHSILLASEGLESRDLIYVPHMVKSFERLDPEACRKRLKDWERAFCTGRLQVPADRNVTKLQKSHTRVGIAGPQSPNRQEVMSRLTEDHRKAS